MLGLHGGAPREKDEGVPKGNNSREEKQRKGGQGKEKRASDCNHLVGGRATAISDGSMEFRKDDNEHGRESGQNDRILFIKRGGGGKKDEATYHSGRLSALCSCIGE